MLKKGSSSALQLRYFPSREEPSFLMIEANAFYLSITVLSKRRNSFILSQLGHPGG